MMKRTSLRHGAATPLPHLKGKRRGGRSGEQRIHANVREAPRNAQCAQGANPRVVHANVRAVVVDGNRTERPAGRSAFAKRSFGEIRGQ